MKISLLALGVLCGISVIAAAQSQPDYTIRVRSELTQISVVIKDRNGTPVRGLSFSDFTLLENGRAQMLTAVDFQSIGAVTRSNANGISRPIRLPLLTSPESVAAVAWQDLRLVVLYFDLTSLETDDLARSLRAARQYIEGLGPADRIAVVSLDSRLRVQQDFTADPGALMQALDRVRVAGQATVASPSGENDAPEEPRSEEDRRLLALRILAARLENVSLKKSIVLFAHAGGGSPEDLAMLTSTLNQTVRAGITIYTVDAAGLVAAPPLGDATRPSSAGIAVLSGQAVAAQRAQALRSQDMLYALARGTGGQAFFDTNDLGGPFRALEEDTREYYLLSYRSSAPRDGKFHTVRVNVNRPRVILRHQVGYYASIDDRSAPASRKQY
jgi:VWFA-related protein